MAMRRKTNSRNASTRRHSIDFSLGGSLGYLVRDANRAFQRLLERRISPHGVTRGQWYFLRVLWEQDGISQRELSARVGMMEPTTVIALRGMEKAGLIRRLRSVEDRRVTRVHLTAKARRLRERLLQVSQGVNDQAAGRIDPAELVRFRSVISQMTANLDRIES
jgi:DNA-binding MarR family transcriptional regulator